MRVAVCISGQLRFVEKTFPFIYQHVILPNQADVFVHAWYDERTLMTECIDTSRNRALDSTIREKVLELYKPKKAIFEPPRDFSKSYSNVKVPMSWITAVKYGSLEQSKNYIIYSAYSMWYSIYKCNELKEEYAQEQGIQYDYVIRMRFDAYPAAPIYVEQLQKDQLYYMYNNQGDKMICDLLNIGSNNVMNVFASIFLYIEYLNSTLFLDKNARQPINFRGDTECVWGNEYLVRDLMNVLNIPCTAILVPIRIQYE